MDPLQDPDKHISDDSNQTSALNNPLDGSHSLFQTPIPSYQRSNLTNVPPFKLNDAHFLVSSVFNVDANYAKHLDSYSSNSAYTEYINSNNNLSNDNPTSTYEHKILTPLKESKSDSQHLNSKSPRNTLKNQTSCDNSQLIRNFSERIEHNPSNLPNNAPLPPNSSEQLIQSSINQPENDAPISSNPAEFMSSPDDAMFKRLNSIRLKIDIEKYILTGVEKIRAVTVKTARPASFRRRVDDVDKKIIEINKKINFLTHVYEYHKEKLSISSQEKIVGLKNVTKTANTSTDSTNVFPHQYSPSPKKKKKFSGQLKLRIISINGIEAVNPNIRIDKIVCTIKLSDAQYTLINLGQGLPTNVHTIKIERINEVEFCFTQSGTICGFSWLKLDAYCLKDKLQTDNNDPNKYLKSITKTVRSYSSLDNKLIDNSDKVSIDKSSIYSSKHNYGLVGYKHSYSGNSVSSKNNVQMLHNDSISFECIIPVEPDGNVHLIVEFEPSDEKELSSHKKTPILALKRQKKVRKVVLHSGHNFVSIPSYHVKKCPICKELLFGSIGYECVACKFSCHKKCRNKIVSICVARLNNPSYGDNETLQNAKEIYSRHHITHSYEKLIVFSANWCSHCGSIITIVNKSALKCKICNNIIHTTCESLSFKLCGLSSQFLKNAQNAISISASDIRTNFPKVQPSHIPTYDDSVPIARSSVDVDCDHDVKVVSLSTTETLLNKPEPLPVAHNLLNKNFTFSAADIPTVNESVNDSIQIFKQEQRQPVITPELKNVPQKKDIVVKPTKKPDMKVRLSDFVFLSVIGRGNFGKVFLAGDVHTKELYAIKILQKDFIIENDEVESVYAEKNVFIIANKYSYPFLTNLHSCFQTESYIYFVMEFIPGGDLMWHIQRKRFTPEMTKFYAIEVLLAIEFLHENRIIYRDIKLDNILITLSGHIKLADYGLCKGGISENSVTSTFCGTPEFMAPEVLLDKPYTRVVDYWAYGVLIYEMFFGHSPFQGKTDDEVFKEIIEKPVHYSPPISPDSEHLIRKLLIKSPNRRLGSGPKGIKEIKQHPYFRGVVWQDYLDLKIDPPFKPNQKCRTDVTNFDTEFTIEPPVPDESKRKITPIEQENFRGFTYVSNWAKELRNKISLDINKPVAKNTINK